MFFLASRARPRHGAVVYILRVPTYLLKTEPDDFSWEDLTKVKTEPWDGVANPTACGVMRDMHPGDEAFIYHTGKERRIMGLARVVSEHYPDPERPENTAKGDVKFPIVDIEAIKPAQTPVTLAEIKADDRFEDFVLVKQSRLSVMLVPPKLDKALRKMAGL